MKRSAFTMLELIFVIVVLGILAVLAMPRLERDPLAEAAEQIARHIRYTQHLAMVDNRYSDVNASWYEERWQIRFLNNGSTYYYDVYSDRDHGGNSGEVEEAIDPLTRERLGSGGTINTPTDSVNLTQRFNITNIGGTCTSGGAKKIVFDHMGRPYMSAGTDIYDDPVPTGGCTIILEHATDGNATLTVHAMTGYVEISY